MSSDFLLKPGDEICGRWQGFRYRIEQELGAGANGRVYLVRRGQQTYALKIGYDPLDFQSEINGLTDLQQGVSTQNRFLIDIDDYVCQGNIYPYYVMKYVHGVHPKEFLRDNGMDWYPVIGFRILAKLAELHARGYIFSDLKSDNILVSGYGTTELIDYGGLSVRGKAVRQFSERYDRGYWRAGTRIADAGYDLFAFAVVCLELADPDGKKLALWETEPDRSVEQLVRLSEQLPACRKVAPVIKSCLTGQVSSVTEAQHAWRASVYAAGSQDSSREMHRRASPALTAALAVAFTVSATVFGMMLYWTFGPGLLP